MTPLSVVCESPSDADGLRRQLAGEMGFILPAVRIQDNLQINANSYVARVKEIEAGGYLGAHGALASASKACRTRFLSETTPEFSASGEGGP